MFRKLLIANRGEIACRVIATARRMGIATVAVCSEADRQAKHVAMADEAVLIGPAPVAESYLMGGRIIDAALEAGAEAIHPGYGFLSENPDFVEATEAAGLLFVGPTADAIRAMGLKDAAKALMEKAGVPVVPGYHGAAQDAATLSDAAAHIGYPVLIKARAGGGGKGMRLVEDADGFADALSGAQREAKASFGDPAVLVEKFIQNPRHIEIQVFGDQAGNVIHLFERDCSLQRRHQKVIEEAPAPGMTQEMRAAMGQAAVEAAKAIGYRGAGTVEFIVDGGGGLSPDAFWFMEMNTRLQVEHPVSEAITGLDFVELQLRIAAGEPLPVRQEELGIDGWAFEARIYAEDVPAGFLPATGRIGHLDFGRAAEFGRAALRADSGVRAGDEISPYYDPMIAKLIAHGPDRASALAALGHALERVEITGIVTNTEFLGALTRDRDFAAGQVDTGMIGRGAGLKEMRPVADSGVTLAGLLSLAGFLTPRDEIDPWARRDGWRAWSDGRHFARAVHDGAEAGHWITIMSGGRYHIDAADGAAEWLISSDGGNRYLLERDGRRRSVSVVRTEAGVSVFDRGRRYDFTPVDPLESRGAADAADDRLIAPMPGLVKRLNVSEGDEVTRGQPLLILEAMKMEHTLTAGFDGRVIDLAVEEGAQVQSGVSLMRLEPNDG